MDSSRPGQYRPANPRPPLSLRRCGCHFAAVLTSLSIAATNSALAAKRLITGGNHHAALDTMTCCSRLYNRIGRMEPNPYDSPETDKPMEAQLARKNSVWPRLLFLGVPTFAGVSITSGVGAIAGEHWIAAVMFFAFAGCALYLAWGWTR